MTLSPRAKGITGTGLGIFLDRAFELISDWIEGSPCRPIEQAFAESRNPPDWCKIASACDYASANSRSLTTGRSRPTTPKTYGR